LFNKKIKHFDDEIDFFQQNYSEIYGGKYFVFPSLDPEKK